MTNIGTIRDVDGGVAKVEARSQTPSGSALNVIVGPGDPISNIPVFMDFEHHQVHEGETYKAIDSQPSLGTATVKYAFAVPTFVNTIHAPHLLTEVDTYDGSARIDIYEGATFTGGTSTTKNNRNRNISSVSSASTVTGVTSTNGTLIDSFYVGGGNKLAGVNRQSSEWVTKSNTTYRIDVVGLAAGTRAVVSFNWYEDLGV